MNNGSLILVDSDAFVAMVKKKDTNHIKAKQLYDRLEKLYVSFATTNYVFSEVITVISQKLNHEAAIDFIDSMKSPDCIYNFIWITPEIEEMAIEIFKRQTSKNVSFVDCTNMALIRHDHLDAIFSFDEIYRKNEIRSASLL